VRSVFEDVDGFFFSVCVEFDKEVDDDLFIVVLVEVHVGEELVSV